MWLLLRLNPSLATAKRKSEWKTGADEEVYQRVAERKLFFGQLLTTTRLGTKLGLAFEKPPSLAELFSAT